ncbi:hypothetical protein C8J32_10415 [Rhizobium sp. PP-CC-3A-592]|nr:hypothetical protein C8J32_10415 [Rhizobium sp. PP-CC-3A-592]
MHLSSHVFDGPRQQPNSGNARTADQRRVAQAAPVPAPFFHLEAFRKADEESDRREYQRHELDQSEYRGHGASVARQHATDPSVLKALATRANDVLLIVLITVIGIVVLFAAHTSFSRVERAYEIAGRV